ncbi:MAG: hypothetical protein KJ069_26065 [Anaerolineae bacterium]|nr:hypothetical protein [Anaerolineae bacterium]
MGVYDELMNLKRPEVAHPEVAHAEETTEVVKTTQGIVMSSQPTAEPENARLPESQITRKPENKIARKPESQKAEAVQREPTNLLDFVDDFLEMKAATKTSFRYPQAMLDMLDDTLDDVRRNYRQKLTKNAVVITALAALLWEYERKRDKSRLVELLVEERV